MSSVSQNIPDDPFPIRPPTRRRPIPLSTQFALLAAAIAFALLVACAAKDHAAANHPISHPDDSLIVGDIAPDFTLDDAHGGKVTLSQLTAKKPVIIIFYLGYSCPRCVHHLRDLANRVDEFEKAGAQIVAISPDSVAATQDSIHEFGNFPFPLLSDPDKKVAAAYGLVPREDITFHGAYVIDTHRKIRFEIRSDHPYDNSDGLLKQVEAVNDRP